VVNGTIGHIFFLSDDGVYGVNVGMAPHEVYQWPFTYVSFNEEGFFVLEIPSLKEVGRGYFVRFEDEKIIGLKRMNI
jgi:hypothetical protein